MPAPGPVRVRALRSLPVGDGPASWSAKTRITADVDAVIAINADTVTGVVRCDRRRRRIPRSLSAVAAVTTLPRCERTLPATAGIRRACATSINIRTREPTEGRLRLQAAFFKAAGCVSGCKMEELRVYADDGGRHTAGTRNYRR